MLSRTINQATTPKLKVMAVEPHACIDESVG